MIGTVKPHKHPQQVHQFLSWKLFDFHQSQSGHSYRSRFVVKTVVTITIVYTFIYLPFLEMIRIPIPDICWFNWRPYDDQLLKLSRKHVSRMNHFYKYFFSLLFINIRKWLFSIWYRTGTRCQFIIRTNCLKQVLHLCLLLLFGCGFFFTLCMFFCFFVFLLGQSYLAN